MTKSKQATSSREAPPLEERKKRNWMIGTSLAYEYAVGQNFVFLTGKVTRHPRLVGAKGHESLWFRMSVPNLDNPKQWLFISVRCRADLATWAWQNLHVDDIVAVVGRIYTGKLRKSDLADDPDRKRGHHPYVIAERISSSYPVQLEQDPRYVRVRRDLLDRIAEFLPEIDLTEVSEATRKRLMDRLAKLREPSDTEFDPDVSADADREDPTANEPEDHPPCDP